MFYATLDSSDGGRINENAQIHEFETELEAFAFLVAGLDFVHVEIGAGRYGDCWIRVHDAPRDDESYFEPFTREQLRIQSPGQHPGGKAWWIEPKPEVLVVLDFC